MAALLAAAQAESPAGDRVPRVREPLWGRAEERARAGLPEGLTAVQLTRVEEVSPEAAAGLREGDLRAGFEDEPFYLEGEGLSLLEEDLLRRPEPPSSYTVTRLRGGKPERVTVSFW